jgi:MFS family permease
VRQRLPPALCVRDFGLFWAAALAAGLATQMTAVAVGWQVYAIHRHPLDLGLIGLLEFAPLPLLALPAGQLADRFPRKALYAISILLTAAVAAGLLAVTLGGASELWPFLVLAAATGVAGALGNPASRSLPPMLVPVELLAGAIAIRSIGFQVATIAGPALGGLLFAARAELVYAVAIGLLGLGFVALLAIREPAVEQLDDAEPATVTSVLGGLHLIRGTPVLLGAITLDLFAVLFGGAVALLPLFARSILHTGPVGLGLLRTAPAVGALLAGVVLAHRPVGSRSGRTLLLAVGAFGASMVVFGLSKWFAVSAVALAFSGAADMVSMNIRSMTIALATPDELRGRVNAVEMVFISASNELGAFESGAAAALVGAVPAVVAGGVLTVALAAVWPVVFPALARIDRLEQLRPRARAGSLERRVQQLDRAEQPP